MNHSVNIETSTLQFISAELAYSYKIVPYNLEGNSVSFKSVSGSNSLKEELEILLGKSVYLEVCTETELNNLLAKNYRLQQNDSTEELHYSSNFLESILNNAKSIGSSDIHFEPFENRGRIRFRIDGKLKEQFIVPLDEYPILINQIKIKAGLDISEKRLPQDGRITISNEQFDYDIRTSTLPTLHGEKVVLRILSKDANHINLNELGFAKNELETYLETLKKPNGIILISGPTGSGKTTTLYATLKKLNTNDTNILTIEDPIEYTLEGINQVQLKENIGLDFASTLRTFLRQDPDIIMVGEIRDAKTANMAIRAALTGHLVLSTIHTNSAWATISRLIDMEIPSFLIASTLNVSIAQRLVRKLCVSCKKEVKLNGNIEYKNLKLVDQINHHYIAAGCNNCFHTGFKGRQAVYEIIPITTELVDRIKSNHLDITDYKKENNIASLRTNAIKLINEGVTSIDECYALLSQF